MTSKRSKMTDESPIKDVYDFLRWLYTATGTWKLEESGKIDGIAYKTYKTITYASYFYLLTTIYFGTALLYEHFQMLSFGLTYFIVANVGVTKMLLLERQFDNVKNLENRLENDLNLPWMGINEWEKLVKAESARLLTVLSKLLFFFAGVGLSVTLVLPMFPSAYFSFVVPTPFDHLSKSALFIPIYMYQSFFTILFIINFVTYDLIFVGIVLRLCDHLDIIRLNLKEIEVSMPRNSYLMSQESGLETASLVRKLSKFRFCSDERYRKAFDFRMRENHARLIKNCIAHHQAVLREVKLVGSIYSYTTFVYVFCGPFLMALLTYVMLSGTESLVIFIQQASFVIPGGIFLFMQCYFGTRLSSKCEDVRFAFYDCPWYEMDARVRKLILGALITMEKTGKFRAGNFVDVALTTFLTTLKTTYNIVTFLKNTS